MYHLANPYWVPPFRYDSEGQFITDSNGAKILDVRGWGHLTGQGSHAIKADVAAAIQDEIGKNTATLLNANWPGPWHKES